MSSVCLICVIYLLTGWEDPAKYGNILWYLYFVCIFIFVPTYSVLGCVKNIIYLLVVPFIILDGIFSLALASALIRSDFRSAAIDFLWSALFGFISSVLVKCVEATNEK